MLYSPEIEALFDLVASKFPDNTTGDITPAMARAGLAGLLAYLGNLTTNQVRGSVFRVPYVVLENTVPTVPTALIPERSRILGMDVQATNGTDQGSMLAGVKADPVSFKLLAYSMGTVDALVDEKPGTTATVKARWVRTSGTEAEKIASYLELPLEDHNVYRGEVYQFTFADLVPPVTRLLEIEQDLTMFSHPVPTGLDTDPYYKSFAPLTSATYDDSALKGLIAALQTSKVEVWTAGPKSASTVYLLLGGIGSGFYQPKADYANSSSVSLAYYNRLLTLPALYTALGTQTDGSLTVKAATEALATKLAAALNLSDVPNKAQAILNLGLPAWLTQQLFEYNTLRLAGEIADPVQSGSQPFYGFAPSSGGVYLLTTNADFRIYNISTAPGQGYLPGATCVFRLAKSAAGPVRILLGPGTSTFATIQPGYSASFTYVDPNKANSDLSAGAGFWQPLWGAGGGVPDADSITEAQLTPAVRTKLNATGGGGATGIDYANPVTLSAAATLTANMAYYVTGAGYPLTLPSASANLGKAIFVQIAATASGLYGLAGTAFYAGESIGLRATADGWVRTSGVLVPLNCRLETYLGQQDALPANAYSTIPLVAIAVAPALAAMVEVGNHGVRVLRTAKLAISAGAPLKDVVFGGEYWLYIRATPASGSPYFITKALMPTANSDVVIAATSISCTVDLAAGTLLDVQVYSGRAANLRGTYAGNECFLTVSELLN